MSHMHWTCAILAFVRSLAGYHSVVRNEGQGEHTDVPRETCVNKPTGIANLLNLLQEGRADVDAAALEEKSCMEARYVRADLHDRKPVLWLHLHNFGGTFICQEARVQGERTSKSNCNWPHEACSAQTNRIGCAEKIRSSQFSFSMLERDMDSSDWCDGALHGTMLRDPIQALQCTISANRLSQASILKTLRDATQGSLSEVSSANVRCLPRWDTYQHVDNFATRSLSGSYLTPPRHLTATHLEAAKERLRNMDVVLILEEIGEHAVQLSSQFNWDLSKIKPSKKVNSFRHQQMSGEDIEFLKTVNSYDYELYQYGKSLAANLTAQAKARISNDH